MKKILVTGGLGFVGSNLVDNLMSRGNHSVVVIDNLSSESSSESYIRNDVEYWIDDIRNLSDEKYADRKFDEIYHLAAHARIQPSFSSPLETFDINVIGTMHVLEYARKLNSPKIVYAGSSSAYAGPKLNPYALAKYTGEQICEMYSAIYGLDISIARFFNVYGDRQPSTGKYATVIGVFQVQKALELPLTVTGNGSQRRDFTHVSDIVNGLIAMSAPAAACSVVNLGTGTNYSIKEVAEMFQPSEIVYIPSRPGEADVTIADISRTKEIYGWTPKTKLKDYIYAFVSSISNKCS